MGKAPPSPPTRGSSRSTRATDGSPPAVSAPVLSGSLLDHVRGQDTAVGTLRRALASDHVHHAYLFEGPDGVGKELTAFGLAQALVCERRAKGSDRACGECSACQRVPLRVDSHGKRERRPAHPDVCVLERGLYEPSQVGRKSPETQDLSIDQVRTLVLAHASFGPHEGRARVFIVRRANELSTGAANALLKTLEEPPARTYFVLLTAEGGTLLPTIRSRCQRVRFGLLGASLVESLLEAWGVAKELRAPIARRCGGSMQRALHLADTEAHDKQEAAVDELLRSLDGPNAEEALVRAEALKKLDRDALAALLTALGDALAQRATAGVRATDRQATDAANTRNAGANAEDARRDAERYALARLALRHLDRNASAQLCVESMLLRMRAVV